MYIRKRMMFLPPKKGGLKQKGKKRVKAKKLI
jgi:hypothetical protein